MLKEIKHGDELIALILRKDFKSEGIKFFTKNNSEQQLGYMKRSKNYEIKRHLHLRRKREIMNTQEVLYIKSGEVSVDLYNQKMELIENETLYQGDFILLVSGGHGFRMNEDSEIIEIKQGPYLDGLDKKRF